MDGFNVNIARKVFVIEGENSLDAMDPHRRDQARVMNLHAEDAVRDQKFAPFFVDRQTVRQQAELFLEETCPAVRILGRKAVPVAIYGTRTGIPKFGYILGRVAKDAVPPKKGLRC